MTNTRDSAGDILGRWLSYRQTGARTHDTLRSGGGRGVSRGDEWRSAGVASVET